MSTRGTHDCKPESTHGVQDGIKKKPRPAGWVQTKCCFGLGCWYKTRCFNLHDDCDYEEWNEENELKCQLIRLEAKKKVARQRAKLLRKPLGPMPTNSPRPENTGDEKKGAMSKGATQRQRKTKEERGINFKEMKARKEAEAREEEVQQRSCVVDMRRFDPPHKSDGKSDKDCEAVVAHSRAEALEDEMMPSQDTVEWKFANAVKRGLITDEDLLYIAKLVDKKVSERTSYSVVVSTALSAYQTGRAMFGREWFKPN